MDTFRHMGREGSKVSDSHIDTYTQMKTYGHMQTYGHMRVKGSDYYKETLLTHGHMHMCSRGSKGSDCYMDTC